MPRLDVRASVLATLALAGCGQCLCIDPSDVVKPDPGCLAIDTSPVDFGSVRVYETATYEVTVSNACDGTLSFVPAAGGSPFYAEISGSFDLGAGESSVITLQFRPTERSLFATTLQVASNDPALPLVEIPVAAQGVAPELVVDVDEVDFGEVPLGCEVEAPLTISNVGDVDLVVDDVSIGASETWMTFDSGAHTLPITLAPQSSVTGSVRFAPEDGRTDQVYLTIHHEDAGAGYTSVSLYGRGVAQTATDTFQQPAYRPSDVLLVVDDSATMAEEQATLADAMSTFVNMLEAGDGDYQVAVLTTGDPAFVGEVVTNASASPAEALAAQVAVGTGGSERAAFATVTEATSETGDAGAGFLRPDATLSIVIVSDGDDTSAGAVDEHVDGWLALKGGDADLLRVHAIAGEVPSPSCGGAAPAERYDQVVSVTGGTFASVCAADWAVGAKAIALGSLTTHDSFALTHVPFEDSIVVVVDGAAQPSGWAYDAGSNSVLFEAEHVPRAGGTVQIRYAHEPESCER